MAWLSNAFDGLDGFLEKGKRPKKTEQEKLAEPGPLQSLDLDPWDAVVWQHYDQASSGIGLDYPTREQMASAPQVAPFISTRINQVGSFAHVPVDESGLGYRVLMRDRRKPGTTVAAKTAAGFERLIQTCGYPSSDPSDTFRRDSFGTFLRKYARDSLVHDQRNAEFVPDKAGRPSWFSAVDCSTVRRANPKRGQDGEGKWKAEPADMPFVQVMQGRIVAEFEPQRLSFGVRRPRTNVKVRGYGFPELDELVLVVTSLLWSLDYNANYFRQGSTTKGLINIVGNMPKDQLRAFRRMWASLVSGVNNCLAGSSVIWTRAGARPIGEMPMEQRTEVWSGTEWVWAKPYRTGVKRQSVLRLGNGTEVRCSPEHRFRVVGDDAELQWRTCAELREGDYVAVNRRAPESDAVPAYKGRALTPDMMEVLGWATGDGSIVSEGKHHNLRFFYHHERERWIRDRHVAIMREFGLPVEPRDRVVSEEEAEQLRERYGFKSVAPMRVTAQVFDADFVRWLLSLGFQPSSEGKVVPGFVHVLPVAHKAAFLRGLFSADGNLAKKRSPCLTVTDARLRGHVRLLLLALGIRTSLSEGRTKVQFVGKERRTIEGKTVLRVKDRDAFLEVIGFLQEHKQPVALLKESNANKKDRISPAATCELVRRIRAHLNRTRRPVHHDPELLTLRNLLNAIVVGQDGCSRPRLLRIMEQTGYEPPSWLLDYHFEPAVSVRDDGEVEMYDLEVESDDHQFVVDGVACHNSWRTPIINTPANGGALQWIPIGQNNKDMEWVAFTEWLMFLVSAAYQMDMAEVGGRYQGARGQQSMFESGNEAKVRNSQERGLEPLLAGIALDINRHFVWPLDQDFEFVFWGLDRQSAEQRAADDQRRMSYMAPNEIRAEHDLPPVPEGNVIGNPAAVQATQMMMQMQAAAGAQETAEKGLRRAPEGWRL